MKRRAQGPMAALTFALITLLSFSNTAHAAKTCVGQISNLFLYTNGSIFFDFGYGVQNLCNISTVVNGIPTQSCEFLYSSLLSTKLSQKRVKVYYHTADLASCNDLGNWGPPVAIPYTFEFGLP